MEAEPWVLAALALVAAAAGWVDAIAGGGGLLQLPSIRAAGIPIEPVPHALGVNKVASICGTAAAVLRYARHGHVRWRALALPGALALVGSVVGARLVVAAARRVGGALDAAFGACFLALAVWQAVRALRGERRAAAPAPPRPAVAAALALGIGVYDGAVGPGTGMFLFWMFTACLGLSPLDATGSAKVVNGLTNAGALAGLLASGAVWWQPALVMAAANVLGGTLGARSAVRRGVRFVRVVTAVVSAAVSVYLIARAV